MILVLGGGLAGLAASLHLGDLPHLVLEGEASPGGLCRTREIDGFLFDYTGHLLHLRDPRAIALVEDLLPGAFDVIERKATIRSRGVEIPFPFQANLHGLPREVVAACVVGFAEALHAPAPADPAASFADWSRAVLGTGISDAFMFPYNSKLFRRDPAAMTADWVSWAVPKPSLAEVVRGALGIENRGMGYNATFRYPRAGGIGIVPDAFARRTTRLRCGARVQAVDALRRTATLEGGEVLEWEALVSTVPLPALLRMVRGIPGAAEAAARLDWSVVACLNLGIGRPGVGGGAHWTYFPDPEVPFYRVGYPSAFSPSVAPPETSSLYVEFGLTRDEPLDPERREREALAALRAEGILRPDDRVLVRDWIRIDPGYVIFDRARQQVMAEVVPALARLGIHPIGRYGAWTYSYMERAMIDGLEVAARLRGAAAGR